MHGTTWRVAFTLAAFYGVRALVQSLCIFCFPDGYVWDFPGVFSLFVAYTHTPDFFYSGHVGVCMLHFLEFQACGWHWWSYYSILVGFVTVFMMYAVRGHYTLDMLCGPIFAHYFFMLVERYVHVFDYHVLGIPLEKRMATADQMKQANRRKAEGLLNANEMNESKDTQKNQETDDDINIVKCLNCKHPVGTYLIFDDRLIHLPT